MIKKQVDTAILISNKINFKLKLTRRDKEGRREDNTEAEGKRQHRGCLIKPQEIIILYVCRVIHNTRACVYIYISNEKPPSNGWSGSPLGSPNQ